MSGFIHGLFRRVYAISLALLPPGFRSDHGAEMRTLFGDRLTASARRGLAGMTGLLARELADVLRTGWSVRRWPGSRERASRIAAGREAAGWRSAPRSFATVVGSAVRQVARNPAPSAVAVVVIALGMAATTSIFVLVDGVALRPLSHRDPESLVIIGQTYPGLGDTRVPMSWPNYEDLMQTPGTGLAAMAAFRWPASLRVAVDGSPEIAAVAPVGGGMFDLLGNRALFGRGITGSDESTGARVAVLDYRYWRGRYGSDRGVLGRTIKIEDTPWEIVGVMGPEFEFPTPVADVFIPLLPVPAMADRDTRFLGVIGRIADGVTLSDARARMSSAMDRLVAEWPEANEGNGIRLDPLRSVVIGDAGPAMMLLLGAVVLLLLLSCASVANLLLGRIASRDGELAVRRALGAGRIRVAAQILTEGLVLAIAGGALGFALSVWWTRLLQTFVPADLPRLDTVHFDARAFAFTAAATVTCGLLFGTAPAVRGSGMRAAALVRRTSGGVAGASHQRLLRGLAAAQIAITVVLLVGAGLLVNSFVRLVSVDTGLEPEKVVTLRVGVTAEYEAPTRVDGFFQELVDRAAALPGVTAAGATWALPFTQDWASGRVTVEGEPRPRGEELQAGLIPVRGRYFAATGMKLIEGRVFDASDYARARAALPTSEDEPEPTESIAVINQAAARMMWPGVESVVGRRFRRGRADEQSPWIVVIGVVADAKRSSLTETTRPEIYRMHPEALWARELSLVARAGEDPVALTASLRGIVHDLDPSLAVKQVGRLSDFVSRSVDEPRFRAILLAAFGLGSLVLALAGVYGVLSFTVSLKTREIGIRMALGANRTTVLATVLRDGALVVAVGLLLGLAATAAGAGLLRSQLFGIGPFDAQTWLGVMVLTTVSGLAACLLPASRASRVPPATAMRD